MPATGPVNFPIPSQSLVSTNLIPVPNMTAAPQIGFGPLGGVAPPVQLTAPKATAGDEDQKVKSRLNPDRENYFFQPPKSSNLKTHHFTNGIDGFDPGSTDYEREQMKKEIYRNTIVS